MALGGLRPSKKLEKLTSTFRRIKNGGITDEAHLVIFFPQIFRYKVNAYKDFDGSESLIQVFYEAFWPLVVKF